MTYGTGCGAFIRGPRTSSMVLVSPRTENVRFGRTPSLEISIPEPIIRRLRRGTRSAVAVAGRRSQHVAVRAGAHKHSGEMIRGKMMEMTTFRSLTIKSTRNRKARTWITISTIMLVMTTIRRTMMRGRAGLRVEYGGDETKRNVTRERGR